MLFGSVSRVEYGPPVGPGDVIVHDVRLVRELESTVFVSGESHVNGVRVLSVDQGVMAFRASASLPAVESIGVA